MTGLLPLIMETLRLRSLCRIHAAAAAAAASFAALSLVIGTPVVAAEELSTDLTEALPRAKAPATPKPWVIGLTNANLPELSAQLDRPETRMAALSQLVSLSSIKLYQLGGVFFTTGDAKADRQMEEAAKIVRIHATLPTVREALASGDRDLQFWGVWFWRGGEARPYERAEDEWLSLLPEIKRLAAHGEANVRLIAIQRLQRLESERAYLQTLRETETECFNLLNLLPHGDNQELTAQFKPYLLKLLHSEDPAVRRNALLFVGSNHSSAPMWQVHFDEAVQARVEELTKSSLPEERKAAAFALDGMKMPLER